MSDDSSSSDSDSSLTNVPLPTSTPPEPKEDSLSPGGIPIPDAPHPLDEIPIPVNTGNADLQDEIPLPSGLPLDSKYSPSQTMDDDEMIISPGQCEQVSSTDVRSGDVGAGGSGDAVSSSSSHKPITKVLDRAQAQKRLRAFGFAKTQPTSSAASPLKKVLPVKGVSVFHPKKDKHSSENKLNIEAIREDETKLKEMVAMNKMLTEKLKQVNTITNDIPLKPGQVAPGSSESASVVVGSAMVSTGLGQETSIQPDSGIGGDASPLVPLMKLPLGSAPRHLRKRKRSGSSSRSSSPRQRSRDRGGRDRDRERDRGRDRRRDSRERDDRDKNRNGNVGNDFNKGSNMRDARPRHDRRDVEKDREAMRGRDFERDRDRDRGRGNRKENQGPFSRKSRSKSPVIKVLRSPHRDDRRSHSPPPHIQVQKLMKQRKPEKDAPSLEEALKPKKEKERLSRKSPTPPKREVEDGKKKKSRRSQSREKQPRDKSDERERVEKEKKEMMKIRKSKMPQDWTEYLKFQYTPEDIRGLHFQKLRKEREQGAVRSGSESPARSSPNSPRQLSKSLDKTDKSGNNSFKLASGKEYPVYMMQHTKTLPELTYGVNPYSFAGYYKTRKQVLQSEYPKVCEVMNEIFSTLSTSPTLSPLKQPQQGWYAPDEQSFCPPEGKKGVMISHLYSDEEMDSTSNSVPSPVLASQQLSKASANEVAKKKQISPEPQEVPASKSKLKLKERDKKKSRTSSVSSAPESDREEKSEKRKSRKDLDELSRKKGEASSIPIAKKADAKKKRGSSKPEQDEEIDSSNPSLPPSPVLVRLSSASAAEPKKGKSEKDEKQKKKKHREKSKAKRKRKDKKKSRSSSSRASSSAMSEDSEKDKKVEKIKKLSKTLRKHKSKEWSDEVRESTTPSFPPSPVLTQAGEKGKKLAKDETKGDKKAKRKHRDKSKAKKKRKHKKKSGSSDEDSDDSSPEGSSSSDSEDESPPKSKKRKSLKKQKKKIKKAAKKAKKPRDVSTSSDDDKEESDNEEEKAKNKIKKDKDKDDKDKNNKKRKDEGGDDQGKDKRDGAGRSSGGGGDRDRRRDSDRYSRDHRDRERDFDNQRRPREDSGRYSGGGRRRDHGGFADPMMEQDFRSNKNSSATDDILSHFENDALLKSVLSKDDFSPSDLMKTLPSENCGPSSVTTSGIGSSNWSDDSMDESTNSPERTTVPVPTFDKVTEEVSLAAILKEEIKFEFPIEITLPLVVPIVPVTADLLPKSEFVVESHESSSSSSSSGTSSSSSSSTSSSEDSEGEGGEGLDSAGVNASGSFAFEEVMSVIAAEEKCTQEVLTKVTSGDLSGLETKPGQKGESDLKERIEAPLLNHEMKRDELRDFPDKHNRHHDRRHSPYYDDRYDHRPSHKDRGRYMDHERPRHRRHHRSRSFSRSPSRSPMSPGLRDRRDGRPHRHHRMRYERDHPYREREGREGWERGRRNYHDRHREGDRYLNDSDPERDRDRYYKGRRYPPEYRGRYDERRDSRDIRGSREGEEQDYTSPPLQSNVADSTISDAELAANNNQMNYPMAYPPPPPYIEGQPPMFQFPMSFPPPPIHHSVPPMDAHAQGHMSDGLSDPYAYHPVVASYGDTSPPRRLSLDERLEVEMGIKMEGPRKPYGYNQGPYYQGGQFIPGGIGHQFPQPVASDTPGSFGGAHYWGGPPVPDVKSQTMMTNDANPLSAHHQRQQCKINYRGDVLELMPTAIPNGSFTIHARVEVTSLNGDATNAAVSGKRVVTIKVPVVPFAVPVTVPVVDAAKDLGLIKKKGRHEKQKKRKKSKTPITKGDDVAATPAKVLELDKGESKMEEELIEKIVTPDKDAVAPDEIATSNLQSSISPENGASECASTVDEKIDDIGSEIPISPHTSSSPTDNGSSMLEKVPETDEPHGLELAEEKSEWKPLSVTFPLPEAGKGILVSVGFREKESKGEQPVSGRKVVKFADGINPGDGTESSDGEELKSPPLPSALEKEKLKLKKLKRKRDKAKRKLQQKEKENLEMGTPPPPSSVFPFCHPGILYQVCPQYAVLYAQALAEKGFEIIFESTHQIDQLVPGSLPITLENITDVTSEVQYHNIMPDPDHMIHLTEEESLSTDVPNEMELEMDPAKARPSNLIEIPTTSLDYEQPQSSPPRVFTSPTPFLTPPKQGHTPKNDTISPIQVLIRGNNRRSPPPVFVRAETDLEGNAL